jgi:hypothetical protein
MSAMTPWQFGRALVAAGVLTQDDVNHASRIVIDCTMDAPVQVYVQRYGNASALERLAPMLSGMLRSGDETAPVKPAETPEQVS